MTIRASLVTFFLVIASVPGAAAQQPPSYARHVKPFLAKYCLECHNADKTKGELNLESYKGLLQGGDKGAALAPGKPDESRIVALVEGKGKERMPPAKAKQPPPAEAAILRAWIAAGAKDDSSNVKVVIPDVAPRVAAPAAITALAYHPDNKRLAAGVDRDVVFIDLDKNEVAGKLSGFADSVTALAFSRDGKTLAAATGAPGVRGAVHLYSVPPTGLPAQKATHVFNGHKDVLFVLAWSPDSKTLASAGYDRIIRLWNAADGTSIRALKDHSDTVYGLAFNHDGALLASASADRAVKVWEVATGRRLYTLGEATDWLYALAWSPDGRHLAAAGVDQSIRVWAVNAGSGKLVQSAYAHEAPIVRLAYGTDGKTLYSIGEDRAVKSWDTATMRERRIYPKQPEAALALAIRPDQKQLAVGRYDGALVLIDETSGAVQAQPLPAKPGPPQINKVTPNFGVRGQAVRVHVEGQHLESVTELIANQPGTMVKLSADDKSAGIVQADVTFPATTPPGVYALSAKNATGTSNAVPFIVDPFTAIDEREPNDSLRTGQKVTLSASIVGVIGKAGDVDYFRFDATKGQEIGIQALTAGIGSKLEPVLQLLDGDGAVVAESESGLLGYVCPQAGTYVLGIRDRDYRGAANMQYRLHVGDLPVVTAVYPLGVQRGTQAMIHLHGVNLGEPIKAPRPERIVPPDENDASIPRAESASTRPVLVTIPANAVAGSIVPVAVSTSRGQPLGSPKVVVGEFPEVVSARGYEFRETTKDGRCITHCPPGMTAKHELPVPGTANGRISRAGATDEWAFQAKKGQRLIVEVHGRRLGTPLDSVIEILDEKGKPVPRATLRCVAKTFTVFRDHDSAGSGIRIETWNDFAMNDTVLIGDELLKIRELPRNPDDDCQFFSVAGQRLGELDTTPTHHSLGTPVYKVSTYPPGSTFPPNGLPVVTLFYRNDDGGAGYGKDSRLFFDPPADGTYQVRIGDARNQGSANHAYRLTVRPPRPDFTIGFSPTAPSVWKAGAVPITVTATRADGFQDAIDLRVENLPPGFSAPATRIPAGENSATFALWADARAKGPEAGPPLKIVAHARIDGQEIVREAVGQLPKAIDAGDLVTTTGESEVTVKPGSEVRLTVTIERRNNFTGRVPLDVRGLPHGVRVLDVGLNGILVIPGETTRTVVLYCEPWVKETEHPFVVLSRREGKNAEHAAKSVLLRVRK